MSACPTCGATYENSVKICPKDGTVLEAPAESTDIKLGQVLDGKYRLDSKLGQGGMGAIYRATHLMLDKQVAVKLIKPELVTSSDLVRRFQREARAAGNLNHPNIAAAYDLGQTQDGTLYIAMELVNGPSLKDVIREQGPMPVDRVVRIMRQVGSALSLAHRHNIIHRDLKPHNIMLATDGRHGVAKLLDFGIAKTFDEASTQLTATGFVLGTPQYMSPEQAAGRPIDGRSDLYSLGIILYEMLIGEVPFNDPSTPAVLVKHLTEVPAPPSRRRPDVQVSPVLEAIALRLLAKDPAERYQSADEFLAALPTESGAPTAAVVAASQYDKTIVLPPPGSASHYAETQAPMAAAGIAPGDPTVMTPPAVTHTQPTPAAAPAVAASEAAATVAGTAAAPVSPAPVPPAPAPAAVAPTKPAVPAAEPWATSGSSSKSGSRPMRDIILLAAALLIVVGGVAFGAAQLGLFGRDDSAASDEPAPLLNEAGATSDAPLSTTTPADSNSGTAVSNGSAPASNQAVSGPVSGTSTTNPGAAAQSRITPPASSSSSGARQSASTDLTPATTAPAAAQGPIAPALPENPAVFFRCTGAAQVCAALRSSMTDALGRQSLRPVGNESAADIVVTANAEVVDESSEQLFGSTFVTRTYAIEFQGSARDGDLVPMPPTSSFTFDAQVGQQRLNEQSRTLSMTAADNVRAFWRARRN